MASSPAPAGSPRTRRQVRIGNVWIDDVGFDETIEAIAELVRSGAGGSVFTPNVDHIVTAEHDQEFRAAYADASLVVPDGTPVIWASRWLGTPLRERVAGSDLILPLMARAAAERWRVYLLGGPPGVGEIAAERLTRDGVVIAGVDAPFVSLDDQVDALADRVRATRPDLVLVGLGAPKQERWIHRALPRLRPAVALGVGATIDFLAGRFPRAPRWMARSGLEWLYRLAREPRRLYRRYLVKDPEFALVVLRAARTPLASRQRTLP